MARRITFAVLFSFLAMAVSIPTQAQTLNPGPPGPFVFDVRLATGGVPSGGALHPDLVAGQTVPTSGYGGSLGAHVYALRVGPGRFGAGIDVLVARGSTPDAATTMAAVAPQLSVNFGTSDGWSYLSAGAGAVRISASPGGVSDTVRSINWGGGARWFLGPHFGVGFDVRIHRLGAGDAVPKSTKVLAAVGISLK